MQMTKLLLLLIVINVMVGVGNGRLSCFCKYFKNLSFDDLSYSEKQMSAYEWSNLVDGREQAVARAVFTELFRRAPRAKEFFKHLINEDYEDLFESPNFKRHMVQRLVPALRSIFENLDDYRRLRQIMHSLGRYHIRRGVTGRDVSLLLCVIIDTLGEAFGNAFSYEECTAMNRVLNAAFNLFIEGLQQQSPYQQYYIAPQQTPFYVQWASTFDPNPDISYAENQMSSPWRFTYNYYFPGSGYTDYLPSDQWASTYNYMPGSGYNINPYSGPWAAMYSDVPASTNTGRHPLLALLSENYDQAPGSSYFNTC